MIPSGTPQPREDSACSVYSGHKGSNFNKTGYCIGKIADEGDTMQEMPETGWLP